MILMSIDPSGSFKHGSGVTGICLVDKEKEEILLVGNIKAKNFGSREDYFEEHMKMIENYKIDVLVIENFILYKSTANSLLNQELETSELIGAICAFAERKKILVIRQNAQLIKTALKKSNVLLAIVNKKKVQLELRTSKKDRQQWFINNVRVSRHILDSIRHAFYYLNKIEKEKKEKEEKYV